MLESIAFHVISEIQSGKEKRFFSQPSKSYKTRGIVIIE